MGLPPGAAPSLCNGWSHRTHGEGALCDKRSRGQLTPAEPREDSHCVPAVTHVTEDTSAMEGPQASVATQQSAYLREVLILKSPNVDRHQYQRGNLTRD